MQPKIQPKKKAIWQRKMGRCEQLNLFSATDSPRDMEQATLFLHDSNTPLQNEANSKAGPAFPIALTFVPAGVCVSAGEHQSFQFTRKVCRETSVFVNPCFIMFWHLEGQSRIIIVRMMTTVSLIKRKLKIGSGYNYHFGHRSSGIILNTVPGL